MFRKIATIAAAAALLPAMAPRDRAPEVLRRSEKWVVDYDRDGCHLLAQFGTGKDVVIARFTRYEPGDHFDFALLGNRFGASNQVRSDARIDFGLKGKPIERRAAHGTAGKFGAVFLSSLRLDGWERDTPMEVAPRVTPEQEASVTGVTIAIGNRRPLRLDFGPLDKPLAQMRHCLETLVESWGYDPAEQAALLRPVSPVNKVGDWLNGSDYPLGALMGGHNGMVQFRLDVDPAGKIAGCYVLARTSPDDFADITCRSVTKRAKLQPALDVQGRAIRSYYVQKVRWQAGGD